MSYMNQKNTFFPPFTWKNYSYSSAKTFRDLISINKRFLKNEVPFSLSSFGAFGSENGEETHVINSRDRLIRLNNLGLMTVVKKLSVRMEFNKSRFPSLRHQR